MFTRSDITVSTASFTKEVRCCFFFFVQSKKGRILTLLIIRFLGKSVQFAWAVHRARGGREREIEGEIDREIRRERERDRGRRGVTEEER